MAKDDDKNSPNHPLWWKLLRKLQFNDSKGGGKSHQRVPKTSVEDWLLSLDNLRRLVSHMRNEIDDLDASKISFDILGAGTFLLQLDLLLIKNRQHFGNYQRRIQDLNLKIPQIEYILGQVQTHCQASHGSMVILQGQLAQRNYMQLNHPLIIQEVQLLENTTKALSKCMQNLNEMALKRDPIYQLFENELFKTLLELEEGQSFKPGPTLSVSPATESMREKAHQIVQEDYRKIGFNLIAYYDTLKRCSILYQSEQVSQSLNAFKVHVEEYLQQAQDSDNPLAKMADSIHGIFFDLEAMRFIRYKGFQDKSRSVKKQLSSMLKGCEFGRDCLKTLQMSPRTKLTLKSRFR